MNLSEGQKERQIIRHGQFDILWGWVGSITKQHRALSKNNY